MSVKPGGDVFFIHTGNLRVPSHRKLTDPVTEVANSFSTMIWISKQKI